MIQKWKIKIKMIIKKLKKGLHEGMLKMLITKAHNLFWIVKYIFYSKYNYLNNPKLII